MALNGKIECKRCHFRGEEEWFTSANPSIKFDLLVNRNYRRPICPMCLQEQKDKHKHKDRAIAKATKMIYNLSLIHI